MKACLRGPISQSATDGNKLCWRSLWEGFRSLTLQFSKLGKFWYVPVPQDDEHLSQSMEICFLIIFLFQLLPANNVLADYTQLWWPHLKVPFRSFNGHSLNQLYLLLHNVEGEVKNCYNHIATLHPFICKNTLNIISIVRDPSNPIQPSPVHLQPNLQPIFNTIWWWWWQY